MRELRQIGYNHRAFCILIIRDITDACNNIRWKNIIQELEGRNISGYLLKMIDSYLKDRKLSVGQIVMNMTRRVPQGSVLGSLSWNGMVERNTETELMSKANQTLEIIAWKIRDIGLELAREHRDGNSGR